jgi:hypothetical protein
MSDPKKTLRHGPGDPGEAASLAGRFKVVGMGRRTGATGSVEQGDTVTLLREPDNPHDTNAVCVLDREGRRVGRVWREHAPVLSALLDDAGMLLEQAICQEVVLDPRLAVIIKATFRGPRAALQSRLHDLPDP